MTVSGVPGLNLGPSNFVDLFERNPKVKKYMLLAFALAFSFLLLALPARIQPAAQAQEKDRHDHDHDFVAPTVFQAAGPDNASIQSTVDAFRAALGNPDNRNNPGPLTTGHREINWDGGGSDATTPPVTPFNVFLNTRGGQFTTPGVGLSQAPASGGPQGGLVGLFGNSTYATSFKAFSPTRLFTPVGSNITRAFFFLPGSNGTVPATVSAFGVVFTDVDQPDGSGPGHKHGNRDASTLMEFFGVDGRLLFSSFVPASPGDGNLSFFGIVFNDARIAKVKIRTGDEAPGPNDDARHDIVMMDDFIYGEPQAIP